MSRYITQICLVFAGFYLFAILFSAVESSSQDLISVLNSLGSFVSAGGALAAILAVIQVARNREADSKYNSSLDMITQINTYLDDVVHCLFDNHGKPKNDRVEWIQAARAILDSEELAKQVLVIAKKYELPELETQLNAKMNRVRLHIYKNLCVKSDNRSGSLPPSFFFGVADWEEKSFEDAEYEANRLNSICYRHNGREVTPIWGSTELDKRSVFVVGRFMIGHGHRTSLESISDELYGEIPEFGPYEGMAIYLKEST
ncbi:hypothetical protein G5S52_05695 [Grimontia sp. S25]|uniref:Uncharacterized protein n=1 Tax=Grimontia sedimenti TaxID=2711294 RepID=A0A6M1RAL8_9GAMM|nr:hypothetical protein [Grimontia sedimenti]NGN97166.1 hypothetical protein [Grimontia sedimenti]